jgi:hypothetical protein
VLLPLWGHAHVRQFFELTLPTWLAPRNLPAVAGRVASEFVFLTSMQDRDLIRRQPELARLEAHMPVGFFLIDDLMVPRNHSTVLTFAWARAIKHFAQQAPDAFFMMVVGDILFPDGTLLSMVRAVEEGHRAVMMGGLHVVHEEVADALKARIVESGGVLALEPRALVRWALERSHPSMAALFVDQGVSHSRHPNHLYWRVDDDTVVAHYFNIFMFCVRPEHWDIEIDAPLDFAFLPQMCPSGPIKVLDDSDDGFFVECARRSHETVFLAPGPYRFDEIVTSLARWMIAEQRKLAGTRLVFHAAAAPDRSHPVCRAADAFAARLIEALPAQPQPHRHHPYWAEQLSAFALERGRAGAVVADAPALTWRSRLRGLFWSIVGRAPEVRPWHPFWHDHKVALDRIRAEWLGRRKSVLVVYDQAQPLTQWLAARCPDAELRRLDRFDGGASGTHDGALIALGPSHIPDLARVLDGLAARLPSGAVVLIQIGDPDIAAQRRIAAMMVSHAGALLRPGFRVETCAYVSSRAQGVTHRLYGVAARLYTRGGPRRVATALLLLLPTLVLALVDNLSRGSNARVRGHCSAVSAVLKRV